MEVGRLVRWLVYLLDNDITLVLGSKDLEHLCVDNLLDITAVGPLQGRNVLGTTKEHAKELVAILDKSILDGLGVLINSLLDILLGDNNAYFSSKQ